MLSDHVYWGYDESIWEAYGVFGQPTTILINADRSFAGEIEFGFAGEDGVRNNVDRLLGA